IFDYLQTIGLIRETNGYYTLAVSREKIATWARLNVHMEDDLRAQFNDNGAIKDVNDLIKMIIRYDQEAAANVLSLVEPRQAFLRAVLSLDAAMRANLIKLLQEMFFNNADAPMTGGTMVDSILLMVRGIKQLTVWAGRIFPALMRGERSIYLVAPEITL